MSKIALVTGGFDPLHSGHISYLQTARQMADLLIVGLNSDAWLARKKGRAFMPMGERATVIGAVRWVDAVIDFDDADDSAKDAIARVRQAYPNDEILFVNGGDRLHTNIPEMDVQDGNLKFLFGAGGFNKANSSSWILEEWKAPKTERPWGYYRVLHEPNAKVKVKELTVNPGQRLSMQRHNDRNEFWFIAEGQATVMTIDPASTDAESLGEFTAHESLFVNQQQWHQLINETDQCLKVIEIQYGVMCSEADIERNA
jgi:D-beta-D-heptose 7-phosphate kinase/D-beta-D-heptose 1-phosphate adenosyltransferase